MQDHHAIGGSCSCGCLRDFYALVDFDPRYKRHLQPTWSFTWNGKHNSYLAVARLLKRFTIEIKQLQVYVDLDNRQVVKRELEKAFRLRRKIGKLLEMDFKGCSRCGRKQCEHRWNFSAHCGCRSPLLCTCRSGPLKFATEICQPVLPQEDQDFALLSWTKQRQWCKNAFLEVSNAMGGLWLWTRNNAHVAKEHDRICAIKRAFPVTDYDGGRVIYYGFIPYTRKSYVGKTEESFSKRVFGHWRKGLNDLLEVDSKFTSELKEFGPADVVFMRLITENTGALTPQQLDSLESEAIDWLRPSKNIQKMQNSAGEQWGIVKQVVTKPRNRCKPFAWRKTGRRGRNMLRNLDWSGGGVARLPPHLEAMLAIADGTRTINMQLVEWLQQQTPPDYIKDKVFNAAPSRAARIRGLGALMTKNLGEERKRFFRNFEMARKRKGLREAIGVNLQTYFPNTDATEDAKLREIVRMFCPEAGDNCGGGERRVKVFMRQRKGRNFKDIFSNVRAVCRDEKVDEGRQCWCHLAPEEWKINGHVCVEADKIMDMEGWNANARYHPSEEEAKQEARKESRKFVENLARKTRVTNTERMQRRVEEFMLQNAEGASNNFEKGKQGRSKWTKEGEKWLKDRLVVGEIDKRSHACFAICRKAYKQRLEQYINETELQHVPSLKAYGRRPVEHGGAGEKFFDRSWEDQPGVKLPSEGSHRFGNLFLLVKKKHFVKREQKIAIRPVVSYAQHRYRKIYNLAARSLAAVSARLHPRETTTVPAMLKKIAQFNDYQKENGGLKRFTRCKYRDVENMFGAIPTDSIQEAIRLSVQEVLDDGLRFAWVPRERTSAAKNKNLGELTNVEPNGGAARPPKRKKGTVLSGYRPRGRAKQIYHVVPLENVPLIIRHGFRWNILKAGRKVYLSKVAPMGNPTSPDGCCIWAARKEQAWWEAASPEVRAEEGKSWIRVRGVDDVFLAVGKGFWALSPTMQGEVMHTLSEDFYGEEVKLLQGTDGEHFGMVVGRTMEGGVAAEKKKADDDKLVGAHTFGVKQFMQAYGAFLRCVDFANTEGRKQCLVKQFYDCRANLHRLGYKPKQVAKAWREAFCRLNFLERRRFPLLKIRLW